MSRRALGVAKSREVNGEPWVVPSWRSACPHVRGYLHLFYNFIYFIHSLYGVFHMMTDLYAGLALFMQEFQILRPNSTESAFQSLV